MVSDNPIKTIEHEAFKVGDSTKIMYIYLLRTKLKTLSLDSFVGLGGQHCRMVIRNRTIAKVEHVSVSTKKRTTILLHPINSATDAIHVDGAENTLAFEIVSSTLLANGFRPAKKEKAAKFLPCPLGTFTNSSSKGAEGCIKCPPGGFYSDDVAHVAKSCKKCPSGSFVPYDKTPGTRKQDCKSCPEGTDTDLFAEYRACKCLEQFYRTHMFEKCHKCGQGGLKCQDDYASLKSGHWWEWRNETQKHRYRDFIANLLTSSPKLDALSVRYPYAVPTPYRCPREESCKGGLDSPCENGYEGPLCAVCSSGYYKQLQMCKQCPSKKWIVGQLSIIAAIVLMLTVALVWTSKRNIKRNGRRPLIDSFFSKLKIIIGFYQVTYGLLKAFTYIKWPDSLEVIAKYSEILQMNIFQIAPIHCLFPGLQVDAYGSLLAMMAINISAISFSLVTYGVRKVIISRSRSLKEDEKSQYISETKERVYRNLFFFLYVTYLSTFSKTANIFPLACRKLCRDEKEEFCYKYMKADYSIKCQGTKYYYWLIGAYICTAYIFALPVASLIALWRQRRVMLATTEADADKSNNLAPRIEMISALRFLFENYKPSSWYWELVEMSRKVILTSGLILVGQESRSYIGLAWIIAGMYGMLFSWIKPIQDVVENRLMATSLAVRVVNLGIGAVSRIPAENISVTVDPYTDGVLFKILVVGANTLVIGLLVVRYAVHLYCYIKEWRENPQWSLSCCLALLLPLNDLQGEIHGMAEMNVLKNQLLAGQFEMPTILTVVKDSGAIDIALEEDLDGDMVQDDNCQLDKYNSRKYHKGTQTELCMLSITKCVLHKPMEESQEEFM